MKLYQQIVCPVDFSDASLNSVQWGLHFARQAQVPLLLFHCYSMHLQDAETASAVYAEMSRLSDEMMRDFIKKLKIESDFPIVSRCSPLDLNQELRVISDEFPMSFIVMSTKGAKGLTRFILGSNAVSVLHAVNIPVLVIPEDQSVDFFQKTPIRWLMGVDPTETKYSEALPWIHLLIGQFGFVIVPGYVDTGKEGSSHAEEFLQWSSIYFPGIHPLLSVADHPSLGIEELMRRSESDGLIMISRDKGWLKDMFRKHLSDEMVFMGRYPVLVVPDHSPIFEIAEQPKSKGSDAVL